MEATKLEIAKPPHKSLVAKLAEVMGAVDHVAKRGRNNFHNYDYATEADIVAAVRKEMASRLVLLVPNLQSIEWKDLPRKNGVERLCTMRILFTFLDGESADKLEINWIGEGSDAGDKAVYKAMTGAEKYVLLKTFLIPTGDDPEDDKGSAPAQGNGPVPGAAARMAADRAAALAKGKPAPKPAALVDVRPGETEAQAKARADHDPKTGELKGGEAVVPFGANAGKKVSTLTPEQLAWYHKRASDKLAEGDERDRSWFEALESEMAARAAKT